MSNFDICKTSLLSENSLTELLFIYRLFGNYHQYYLQCHLYLMNKLILTNTTVKCFQVKFLQQCSRKFLEKRVRLVPIYQNTTKTEENDWIEFEKKLCKEIDQDDVRLFLYLKTIVKFLEEEKEKHIVQLLSPLLVLHVALLIRLSLIDRHLPSNFPSIKYSSLFSELIIQFQQRLALCLRGCSEIT